jgi:serine/threonine protein kinase
MRLQNGAIKLIDFGLAVSKDPTKSNGRITAGTNGYASPEQATE